MTNMESFFFISLGLFIISFLGLCKIVAYETKLKFARINADQKLARHMAISKLNK